MNSHQAKSTGPLPSRVVVVEDNEADVYLISLALREAGFPQAPVVFRDGEDAIASFRTSTCASMPELILLDLNLPRVDGKGVVEMLRAEPAFDRVPVMLMSSGMSPADEAKTQELRGCIYTPKPSSLEAFMSLGLAARDFWTHSHGTAVAV